MMLKKYLLTLSLVLTGAFAEELYWRTTLSYKGTESEFWSCFDGVSEFVYDFVAPLDAPGYAYYQTTCTYPPAIGTLFFCGANAVNNDTEKMNEIFHLTSKYCSEYSMTVEDWTFYKDQYENATQYYIPLSEISNVTLPIYNPTLPDMTLVDAEILGYKAYYWNLDSGTWYSVGILVYFLILIIIGTIHNFARHTGLGVALNKNKLSKYIQSYITLPALFPHGSFSTPVGLKWFSSLFPNRTQFLVETGLFILQVAFYSNSYRQQDGVSLFGSADAAWQRGVADRTGIMAFGKIPLLVLFAGRNNFLCWLTGWSYMTFIQYHKVLARWMFLDAMIHSVAYTIMELGYYVEDLKSQYFACGVAATVLAGVILLFSMHVFRRHWYEYFLLFHVILAICFIAMCWYHCNTLGWCEWLIATCCVWFFDRLVRIVRMAAFGYRTAQITAIADDLLRVEVCKPRWWIHTPGQYGFIYFAGIVFWENHPFTLVVEGDNICIYIKVKKGVTRRVWNKLTKNGGSITWKVCIEGPYGGDAAPKAKKYSDILMIAGGSGVPGVLDSAITNGKGTFIWTVRELKDIKPYLTLVKRLENVEVSIYVTRENGEDKTVSLTQLFMDGGSEGISSDISSKESKEGSDMEKTTKEKGFTVKYGRPNLAELIPKQIEIANGNSVGILACGPPQLMDDIRHYVSQETIKSNKSIDYFDEYQTW